ncbi:MAG: helix-hairpin-helix domain-containing protein, partial [Gemmatimonadota bacterium]
MENLEIAGRLEELADLLEIGDANPFRVRAYRNAVRTVKGLTRRVADMAAAGDELTDLPGIGEDISSHIQELLETGDLAILEEVTREVPRELAVLTRLDGVGPKKVAKLWKELGITEVDELEAAVREGRVETLSGFGRKSAEKILRSIDDFRKHQGRFLRHDAVQYLRPLLEHLNGSPGLKSLEVAGSHRRGKETVGDIDLLAVVDGDSEEIMRRFTSFEGVGRVEMAGTTRGSVVLRSGLPVDLRVVPEASYGAALHYFTGSKEHNVAIRMRARRRGLQVSEYGVFELDGSDDEPGSDEREGRRVGGRTEDEVFEAVELPWIPPELRQARGEIEVAEAGRLPRLVEPSDIRGDLHMHSLWSDGKETIETMARACRERGYEYLAITDHSQAVTVANGLTPDRVREQGEEVARAREAGYLLRLEGDVVTAALDETTTPDDLLAVLGAFGWQ